MRWKTVMKPEGLNADSLLGDMYGNPKTPPAHRGCAARERRTPAHAVPQICPQKNRIQGERPYRPSAPGKVTTAHRRLCYGPVRDRLTPINPHRAYLPRQCRRAPPSGPLGQPHAASRTYGSSNENSTTVHSNSQHSIATQGSIQ